MDGERTYDLSLQKAMSPASSEFQTKHRKLPKLSGYLTLPWLATTLETLPKKSDTSRAILYALNMAGADPLLRRRPLNAHCAASP